MRRIQVCARPGWRDLAERVGFVTHTLLGEPYWWEEHYYAFEASALERDVDAAVVALGEMCDAVVERAVVDDEILRSLHIPEPWWDRVAQSWRGRDPALVARFDLAYDGGGDAAMLEVNADTPGMAFEWGVVQWLWLEDALAAGHVPPGSDQHDRLHAELVDRFRSIAAGHALLHFAASHRNVEDRVAANDLRDCAEQAGCATEFVAVEDLGVDRDGRITDLQDRLVTMLVKVYRWALLIREPFADALRAPAAPEIVEPSWKLILSSKGVMAWLWRLFPGHPNLVPTWFADDTAASPGADYVTKPLRSVKGANVRIVARALPGGTAESDGPYGLEPRIVQAYRPLPTFRDERGHVVHAQVGAWAVAGRPAGIGVVEGDGPIITQDASRFLPHVILP
ncbi:glutathionylspermidine synthase family protein [Candidatus Binatia bacterium]|nr:glutathionylspermidine synthase family protein [Candidatus Binatia bacterium]